MQLPDVNILVYAHRRESPSHQRYAQWLTALAIGDEPFALSETVMQGFIRVVTNPQIFDPPSSAEQAFRFLSALIERPACHLLRAGPEHWRIFRGLCEAGQLRGKIVADAAHAALAIETGSEWVTADTDFARFAPALRWRHL
ncbi:MAG TPA: TA system VapC family ribonuclease toxin [Bryobacteraceae bacterium]|nr:TA system VapC family ribonuclease toxin [Bryobacteraceae bacterium]